MVPRPCEEKTIFIQVDLTALESTCLRSRIALKRRLKVRTSAVVEMKGTWEANQVLKSSASSMDRKR